MNPFSHAYENQTFMGPLGLAVLVLCAILTVSLPRRLAVWPIIAATCFVSAAQRVAIMSIDFDTLRILIIAGWIRLFLRGETRRLQWTGVDVLLVAWAIGHVVFPLIRTGTRELVYKTGYALDALTIYFLFRMLLRGYDDVRQVVRGFALFALPTAACFLAEWITRWNMFSVFGGVSEYSIVRDGRLRCQGAFAHPIIAGCFWATLLPFFVAEWWHPRRRRLVVFGGTAAVLTIVVTCASSTPVASILVGALGGMCFLIRRHLRQVRWGLAATVVALHLVMKAPVWHLISRIDIIGGNSSFQRFQLIDGAIKHWNEWWLIGSTVGTAHWGWATFDDCNYYVVQGQHGGIVLLGLFVLLLAYGLRSAGMAVRESRGDVARTTLAWAAGVCLFVHCVNFIGVTYFGQMPLVLFASLAIVAVLRQPRRSTRRARAPYTIEDPPPSLPACGADAAKPLSSCR